MNFSAEKVAGHIHIVGAGPGRRDWLCTQAVQLLGSADLIAYDDLIHPELLHLAGSHSRLLAVGYRANQHRHGSQAALVHDEVLAAAKAGQSIVRFKSGDPMLFARTWEEIAILDQNHIPWSIVPGITAGFAAAASLALPLTHRGLSSAVQFTAGNHASRFTADSDTIILYMPRTQVAGLCKKLIEKGRSRQQSAVFVQSAASNLQNIVRGNLENLAELLSSCREDLPGLVIIGDTVELSAQAVRATNQGILHGKRIVVGRSSELDSPLSSRLADWGADVISYPHVQCQFINDHEYVISSLKKLNQDSVLILNSAASVKAIQNSLRIMKLDVRQLDNFPILVIGSNCQQALAEIGWQAAIYWSHIPAAGIFPQDWPSLKKLRWQFMGSHEAYLRLKSWLNTIDSPRDILCGLTHQLHFQAMRIAAPKPDLLILPNRRSAELILNLEAGFSLTDCDIAVMGESTAEYLRSQGISRIFTANQASYDGMMDLVKSWSLSLGFRRKEGA